ncbi:MAG TPA: glycosyltransferase family 4 protein [Gemmatimonadaceae bacterium]
MRILIVSQWFDPEPTFKGLTFAQELVARGHEVEVLTGFPNYPGGRVYPGYRIRPWRRETINGVRVTRVMLYPSHDRSAVRRMLNYLSFAAAATIGGSLLVGDVDVVYVYHPPLTAAIPALVIGFLRRAPTVLDIQDLWPDSLAATRMFESSVGMRVLGAICRLVYGAATKVATLCPGMARTLVERGVPNDKVQAIYNWCDEVSMVADQRDSLVAPLRVDDQPPPLKVLFAGNMGPAQGLDTVLDAAALCAASVPHARFVFVGGGIDRARLESRAAAEKLSNVEFLPRRPPSEMGELLASADLLLVHLRRDPLFSITIPSKTQAYMAAGRPILMAVHGDAADLVRAAGAGIVCPPSDPAALADAVRRFAELPTAQRAAMGDDGRAYYKKHLSLAVGVSHFESLFHAAAQSFSPTFERS